MDHPNRSSIFISDLHLGLDAPKTKETFLGFLENIDDKVEAIYILGDLFKFWIGDDDVSVFSNEIRIALKKTSQKVQIYLMAGNRDFLLGNKFAEESGCILIEDPCIINLYGKKTLLTHGDLLTNKYFGYSVFRKLVRNSGLKTIFLKLPKAIRKYLAERVQKHSSRRKKPLNHIINSPLLQNRFLKKFGGKFDFEQIIYGHIHLSTKNNITLNGKNIVCFSLDEWSDLDNRFNLLIINKVKDSYL